MKLMSWMQNKLSGKQAKRKPLTSALPNNQTPEEFSDWPNDLLAIGTFGNSHHKQVADHQKRSFQDNTSSSCNHLQENLTPEEVGKLEKEVNSLLLHKQTGWVAARVLLPEPRRPPNLAPDLCCPRGEELSRIIAGLKRGDDACPHCNVVLGTGARDHNFFLGRRSLSFLLKKMLVCQSGFAPAPPVREPISESRMEKILRTIILHKKIYPQSAAPSLSKCLENSHKVKSQNVDELNEKADDGSKWVKTDSEYIVLEI